MKIIVAFSTSLFGRSFLVLLLIPTLVWENHVGDREGRIRTRERERHREREQLQSVHKKSRPADDTENAITEQMIGLATSSSRGQERGIPDGKQRRARGQAMKERQERRFTSLLQLLPDLRSRKFFVFRNATVSCWGFSDEQLSRRERSGIEESAEQINHLIWLHSPRR